MQSLGFSIAGWLRHHAAWGPRGTGQAQVCSWLLPCSPLPLLGSSPPAVLTVSQRTIPLPPPPPPLMPSVHQAHHQLGLQGHFQGCPCPHDSLPCAQSSLGFLPGVLAKSVVEQSRTDSPSCGEKVLGGWQKMLEPSVTGKVPALLMGAGPGITWPLGDVTSASSSLCN